MPPWDLAQRASSWMDWALKAADADDALAEAIAARQLDQLRQEGPQ